MDTSVTIYSTPVCHFCQAAKEFFAENNVEYTEHDVAADGDPCVHHASAGFPAHGSGPAWRPRPDETGRR